jgi:hypothetical protein
MKRREVLIQRLKKHVKVCFDGHYPTVDDDTNAGLNADALDKLLEDYRRSDTLSSLFATKKDYAPNAVITRPGYLAARLSKWQKAVPEWFVDRFARAFWPLRKFCLFFVLSNYACDNRLNTLFVEKVRADAQAMWDKEKRLRARFNIRNALRVTYMLLKAYERACARLYAPGGAGAVAAKSEFEATAKKQRLE